MTLDELAAAGLTEVESVKVARLQPGDVVVIRSEQHIPQETRNRIERIVEDVFRGHKCIVLCGGLSMEIARGEG